MHLKLTDMQSILPQQLQSPHLQAPPTEALNVEGVAQSGHTGLESVGWEGAVAYHSIQQFQTQLQRMEQ